jgi:DNA-directed RNA polymerase beta' subunit
MDKVVEMNNLKNITGQTLYKKGDIPDENGLVSNEIFGTTITSRRQTYGYIDLYNHYFHPHVYLVIKALYKNIVKIISGELYCKINENGELVEDENGETGIKFLYKNWNKINWDSKNTIDTKTSGIRVERLNLLKNYKKDEIFIDKMLVIPPFYRDMNSSTTGNEIEDINKQYQKLIRSSKLIKDQALMFDFELYKTDYEIQMTLNNIYDYFKTKLEKKTGIIRKYLMGKNVDYCTRTVISAPRINENDPDDMFTSFEYSNIPISQVCSLAYPFVMHELKIFFNREVIDKKGEIQLYDLSTGKLVDNIIVEEPESYFSEAYIKNIIDTFVDDPESRFNLIEIPNNKNKKLYLHLSGSKLNSEDGASLSKTIYRPMTWTDLLYLACEEAVKNKHCLITRYPVSDEYGLFVTKIRVNSTLKTEPVSINGTLYKWYPVVELDTPTNLIGSKFIDSCQFSNSYLKGLVGDYDGDQTTVKIIFTQEANEEAENFMKTKSNFINTNGTLIRVVGNEVIQTLFDLTKDIDNKSKELSSTEKAMIINMDPKDLTLDKLNDFFADYCDMTDGRNNNITKSRFNTNDYFTLLPSEYAYNKSDKPIKTTIGRFIVYKILIERSGIAQEYPYFNEVITKKGLGKMDSTITNLLENDNIDTAQMRKYIDYRDWLGLAFNATLAPPFTKHLIITPDNTAALKEKLIKEHEAEIKAGDTRVIENIENILKKSLVEDLKDDPGIDLVNSGSRASLDNHLKNFMLTRGSVKNANTGEYEIISRSLMDGLDKKDIPAHANSILNGAYAKTVSTADSGYMGKKLSAGLQGESLGPADSDCGSVGTLPVTITNKNKNDYLQRYIVERGKLVLLTEDNISNYVNKTVKMRSPMFCVRVGENKCICNKCAGEFFYKIGKTNIGLAAMKIGSSLTNLNMKKFHENLIVTKPIDMDDILL